MGRGDDALNILEIACGSAVNCMNECLAIPAVAWVLLLSACQTADPRRLVSQPVSTSERQSVGPSVTVSQSISQSAGQSESQ